MDIRSLSSGKTPLFFCTFVSGSYSELADTKRPVVDIRSLSSAKTALSFENILIAEQSGVYGFYLISNPRIQTNA